MAARCDTVIVRVLLAFAALAWLGTASAETTLRPFDAASYGEIVTARAGKPFLLVFWSTECPPCHGELATLAALRRQGRPLDLVLVATDDIASAGTVAAVLEQKGLTDVENWVFAEPVPERIRFAIDPRWYGELPRSYLFDAAHARTAHTGLLTAPDLNRWLDTVTPR